MNVIVVGAGIAGHSTAWSLVKAGHNVSIVEQGPLPNPLAASGDHHRIIRRAYRAGTGYGRLITEAYAAWDEMWADLGESHLDPRGFLCISREPGDEAEEYREGLEEGNYPFDLYEPDAASGLGIGPCSTMETLWPALTSDHAIESPAIPAPTTITFIKTIFPQQHGLAQRIGQSGANIRSGACLASRANDLE